MTLYAYSGRYYESNLFTSSLIPYIGNYAFILHAFIVIGIIYLIKTAPVAQIEYTEGISLYTMTYAIVMVQYIIHDIISVVMLI